MMVPCQFIVPSTLYTSLWKLSFLVPSQSLATVAWSIKFSVAPELSNADSSACP